MKYKGLEIDDKHPEYIKIRYMKQHDEALALSQSSISYLKNVIIEEYEVEE